MLHTNILEIGMTYNKNKPDFWDKTPETFAHTEEYPDGVYLKADGKPDPRKGNLSNRQRTFAELIVEGIYSNTECARRAGFRETTAKEYARKLLNGIDFPHVVELITELREEKQRRYGVTTHGQLERLAKLSKGAEDAKQYSAAINAEKIRSALGGLTIDRRETINTIDQMSRDEVTARLAVLQSKYPQLFQTETPAVMKDITPHEPRARSEIVELSASKQTDRDIGDTDRE